MLNESIVYLFFQLIEYMVLMLLLLFDLKFVVIISMHPHLQMKDVDKQPEQEPEYLLDEIS